MVMQEAAVLAQMTLERLAGQAERLVADSFRSSFAREARRARSASLAMRNASSTLSASVTSSGSSGLVTTNPPSSAGVSVSTSFPSETVYDLGTNRACRKSRRDAIDAPDHTALQTRAPRGRARGDASVILASDHVLPAP